MAEENVPVTVPAAERDGDASEAAQNRTARPGGTAGGEPTQSAEDAARADREDAAMRARNFGDHKGASIDRTP